jgi:hypothetical protein
MPLLARTHLARPQVKFKACRKPFSMTAQPARRATAAPFSSVPEGQKEAGRAGAQIGPRPHASGTPTRSRDTLRSGDVPGAEASKDAPSRHVAATNQSRGGAAGHAHARAPRSAATSQRADGKSSSPTGPRTRSARLAGRNYAAARRRVGYCLASVSWLKPTDLTEGFFQPTAQCLLGRQFAHLAFAGRRLNRALIGRLVCRAAAGLGFVTGAMALAPPYKSHSVPHHSVSGTPCSPAMTTASR